MNTSSLIRAQLRDQLDSRSGGPSAPHIRLSCRRGCLVGDRPYLLAPGWYRSAGFRGLPHQEELDLQLIRSNLVHTSSLSHTEHLGPRGAQQNPVIPPSLLGLLGFNPEIPCRFPRAGPPNSSRSSHISLFSLRTIQSELYRAVNRPTTGKVRVSSTCFLPAREPASARDAGGPHNNSSSQVSGMRFGRCSPGAHPMARGAEPEARLEPGRTEHHAGRSAVSRKAGWRELRQSR
jgi:hypothetical protein